MARVGSGNSCAKRKYSYFTAKMRYLFFVKMIDLRFVKFLKKTYYNSLVHRRSLNLINGAYALKLFHADLDFALFVDFKNFVLATVIGLLRASVVNSRYLTGRRHTQITTTGEFSRSDPLTTSGTVRAEFARIFGTRALLVNKKRLTKIQFKPGYSTFFRRLRWDYKQVNNIDLLYQKRLTHHIKRFKNVNNMENLRAHTLGLKLLLVFAHLFTTLAEASFAIAGGVVYINNNIVRVDGFQLQAGDMISFTVSYQTFSYFLYQRFMRYSLLQRGTRLFRKYKSLATYPGRWVVQQYGFLNKNL